MIQITKSNKSIVEFVNNAEFITRQLSTGGKRNRYLGVLQFSKEHFEKHSEAVTKRLQRIQEKHAKVKEGGEFVYEGTGNDKGYVYTKESKETLDNEVEKYLDEVKSLEVDDAFYLKEDDLPKHENGEVNLSNQLIKIFSGFVIDEKLANKLLYPGLDINE